MLSTLCCLTVTADTGTEWREKREREKHASNDATEQKSRAPSGGSASTSRDHLRVRPHGMDAFRAQLDALMGVDRDGPVVRRSPCSHMLYVRSATSASGMVDAPLQPSLEGSISASQMTQPSSDNVLCRPVSRKRSTRTRTSAAAISRASARMIFSPTR